MLFSAAAREAGHKIEADAQKMAVGDRSSAPSADSHLILCQKVTPSWANDPNLVQSDKFK